VNRIVPAQPYGFKTSWLALRGTGAAVATSEASARLREPHYPADDAVLQRAARHLAQLSPPAGSSVSGTLGAASPGPAPSQAAPATALPPETLWSTLVRRVAWSSDARRATVVLELGVGALAGATLVVQSCEGRVTVRLETPTHLTDLGAWRARITARLAARGLDVERVDVE
jgi:hypothetical protein